MGPSNPWHDYVETKRLQMLERRLPLNLDEEQDTKSRKIFVQGGLAMFVDKDLTPECLFKQCDADAEGRTSHTEVISHDDFAAMRDQFGLLGAKAEQKAKADEKKRRQSHLNYLMDKDRLTQEKLQALW